MFNKNDVLTFIAAIYMIEHEFLDSSVGFIPEDVTNKFLEYFASFPEFSSSELIHEELKKYVTDAIEKIKEIEIVEE